MKKLLFSVLFLLAFNAHALFLPGTTPCTVNSTINQVVNPRAQLLNTASGQLVQFPGLAQSTFIAPITAATAFAPGVLITGSGFLDGSSTVCVLSAATYGQYVAPVSCVKPIGAKKAEIHNTITELTPNGFIVAGVNVIVAPCTTWHMNGSKAPVVGDDAEVKGYYSGDTVIAISVTLN